MMKRMFFLMIVMSVAAISANAQTDSLAVVAKAAKPEANIVQLDSLTMAKIDIIYSRLENVVPRYKIYQTENIHILLKLDTATGKVWMVQYGTGGDMGTVVPIDDTSLLSNWDEIVAGRFELYPTKNMYNFILIDTKLGNTYQVQWHILESNRMRIFIW